MMSRQKTTLAVASKALKQLRPSVSPNLNFMGQLLAWEQQCLR
jgi:hypothetical protein